MAIETIEQLEAELADMRGILKRLGLVVEGMDARLRAQQTLIDLDHAVLTKIAGLPPRPKGDKLAN